LLDILQSGKFQRHSISWQFLSVDKFFEKRYNFL
jgi:hypothetical protein